MTNEEKRIKELERENRKLKSALSELELAARKLRHTVECSSRRKDLADITAAILKASRLTSVQ